MAHVSPQQVSPGDEITADSVNVPINQIAAQINGNLDDTNISGISGSKIAGGSLPNTALTTPPKYKVGNFTITATGTATITGVGFRGKLVRFYHLRTTSSVVASGSVGAADDSGGQFATTWAYGSATGSSRSYTNRCIHVDNTSGSARIVAEFGAFTDDGFTLNVTSYNADYGNQFAYEVVG